MNFISLLNDNIFFPVVLTLQIAFLFQESIPKGKKTPDTGFLKCQMNLTCDFKSTKPVTHHFRDNLRVQTVSLLSLLKFCEYLFSLPFMSTI